LTVGNSWKSFDTAGAVLYRIAIVVLHPEVEVKGKVRGKGLGVRG